VSDGRLRGKAGQGISFREKMKVARAASAKEARRSPFTATCRLTLLRDPPPASTSHPCFGPTAPFILIRPCPPGPKRMDAFTLRQETCPRPADALSCQVM
jgi:hypothetical protein